MVTHGESYYLENKAKRERKKSHTAGVFSASPSRGKDKGLARPHQ